MKQPVESRNENLVTDNVSTKEELPQAVLSAVFNKGLVLATFTLTATRVISTNIICRFVEGEGKLYAKTFRSVVNTS